MQKFVFRFVLSSFSKRHHVFSITYWLRSYYFCIFLARLRDFETGSLLCPAAFRGATLPLGRVPRGKAHHLGSTCAFGAQNWLRFEFVLASLSKVLPVFSITYWLRSYYFCVSSESCLPGSLAKFRGREIDESGSPGMAHRLPKLQPERSGRRLASQLLDSLTPRLLDCTWRQKPQAGTTDENKRGLSGITYWQGRTACPTPQNNCSLCRPVCQVKNAPSTKSPT